jgi:hypothetical protein
LEATRSSTGVEVISGRVISELDKLLLGIAW